MLKYLFLASLFIFASCTPHERVSTDVPDTDTIEHEIAPTVQEVLEWREQLRYEKFADSVYLAMPTQILTNILVTKGTDLSNTEIVGIYLSNKEYYDNAIKGAMDIQKQYIPDSMPKPSIPQTPLDTVKAN